MFPPVINSTQIRQKPQKFKFSSISNRKKDFKNSPKQNIETFTIEAFTIGASTIVEIRSLY